MDKWMNITDMGYIIASRYNVIVVSLSQQQSMTFFPLISQVPLDFFCASCNMNWSCVWKSFCIGNCIIMNLVNMLKI